MAHSAGKDSEYGLVIIGGGAAALGAAIYAGRFQMKTALIAESIGGTMMMIKELENYPGFLSISGMELANRLTEHAKKYVPEMIERRVERIERCKEGCFKVFAGKKEFHTRSIVFATGTEWKKLGVPGEQEFKGRGVHYCGLCDGPFYKNKIIAVVGGSDSAVKEALFLSEYGKKVYLIHRREELRAEPANAKKVKANKKIEVINNANVVGIEGGKFVDRVIFGKPYKGSKELKVDGVFIEVGHVPSLELAKSIGVNVDEKGYIIIDRESKTNVEGFFAAGDVANNPFRQVITAVAQGSMAAYSAYQYLKKN